MNIISKLRANADQLCRDAADEIEYLSKARDKMEGEIEELKADVKDMIDCLGMMIAYLLTLEEFKGASPEDIMDWIDKNIQINRHLLDARTDH